MTLHSKESILADLQTSSLERQVSAIDKFFFQNTQSFTESDRIQILSASLKAFETAKDPLFLGERLLKFGQEVIPRMLELIVDAPNPGIRTLAALILLHNGNRSGVPVLLDEIEQEGDYSGYATIALANSRIANHVPHILKKLRKYVVDTSTVFPTTKDDEILTHLQMLKKLGVTLPADIKDKFSNHSMPSFFLRAIENYDLDTSDQ